MKDSYGFYVDKLNPEYRHVFDQVELYIGTQRIDDNTREENMGQLLDMFLTAQTAGKPVEKITGSNIEAFCKTFCSEFSWKNRLYSLMDGLKGLSVGLLLICVLDVIELAVQNEKVSVWQAVSSFPISGYFLGVLCGCVAGMLSNMVVRRFMFKSKRVSMRLLKVITWGFTGISCAAMFVLVLSDRNEISCPIWVVALCAVGYLMVYYLLSHKRLKEQKRDKVKFSDLVGEEMKKTLPEEMEKKYQSVNKRRIRRGMGKLSMEEFLDNEEKACNDSKKLGFLYVAFPVIITALSLPFQEFEGAWDMVLYVAIMLAVEYFFVLGCWRIECHRCTQCRAWIKMKREQLSCDRGSAKNDQSL